MNFPGANGKAMHTIGIPFLFDNIVMAGGQTGQEPEQLAAANTLAATMSEMLISYGRTGNPNFVRLPAWPPYDLKNRSTIHAAGSGYLPTRRATIRRVLRCPEAAYSVTLRWLTGWSSEHPSAGRTRWQGSCRRQSDEARHARLGGAVRRVGQRRLRFAPQVGKSGHSPVTLAAGLPQRAGFQGEATVSPRFIEHWARVMVLGQQQLEIADMAL